MPTRWKRRTSHPTQVPAVHSSQTGPLSSATSPIATWDHALHSLQAFGSLDFGVSIYQATQPIPRAQKSYTWLYVHVCLLFSGPRRSVTFRPGREAYFGLKKVTMATAYDDERRPCTSSSGKGDDSEEIG